MCASWAINCSGLAPMPPHHLPPLGLLHTAPYAQLYLCVHVLGEFLRPVSLPPLCPDPTRSPTSVHTPCSSHPRPLPAPLHSQMAPTHALIMSLLSTTPSCPGPVGSWTHSQSVSLSRIHGCTVPFYAQIKPICRLSQILVNWNQPSISNQKLTLNTQRIDLQTLHF